MQLRLYVARCRPTVKDGTVNAAKPRDSVKKSRSFNRGSVKGEMREGIVLHLQQDILFDRFIREQIDCSRKYEDIFFFHGQKMNGKELRNVL